MDKIVECRGLISNVLNHYANPQTKEVPDFYEDIGFGDTAKEAHLQLISMLNSMKEAKIEHIQSNQCERGFTGGCTACHYWSGAINTLAECLDEPFSETIIVPAGKYNAET